MARWCDLIYKGDGCYLGYPPDAARDAHDKKQLRDEKKYIFSSSRVSPESNGVLCTANRLTVHDKKNATVVIWDPTDIPSELQITELPLSLESTRARDVQRQCRTFFSRLCVRFFVRNMNMAIVQCGCSSVNIRVAASPTPPKHQHLPPLSSGAHRMLQKKTHSADHSGFRGPSFTWGRRGESLRRACPSSYPPPRFDGVLDRRLLSPRLAFFLSS